MNKSAYDVPEFAKAIGDGAISFEEAVTALHHSKTVEAALAMTGLTGYCDPDEDGDEDEDEDAEDDHWDAVRTWIVCDGEPTDYDREHLPGIDWAKIEATVTTTKANPETWTYLLLSLSLCPMHERDYAICFDDEDPECAAIRETHPSHST